MRSAGWWSGTGGDTGWRRRSTSPTGMLDDEELITGLRDLLDTIGVEPERLTIEVVPSGPGAGSSIDHTQIERLRRLGVRLSLDDLGRASSIAAIRTLPLDQAKIDAMFLHNLGRDERSGAIVGRSSRSRTSSASRSSPRESRPASHGTSRRGSAATAGRGSSSVTHSTPRSSASGWSASGRWWSRGALRVSPGRQSGSSRPAAAFAARARTKSRSDNRFR